MRGYSPSYAVEARHRLSGYNSYARELRAEFHKLLGALFLHSPILGASEKASRAAFFDLVIGRDLEQRLRRLGAIDVGQPVNGLAESWVVVFAQNDRLQIGRIPALRNDLYRAVVAYPAFGDSNDRARAFSLDAFNHLFAERFGLVLSRGLFRRLLKRLLRWRR